MGLERGNLLVAYGMGLGKTIIQLAICEELRDSAQISSSALVVPASLKWQWAQSIAQFTDVTTRQVRMKDSFITVPTEDYCVVIDGTKTQRDKKYKMSHDIRPSYVILGYENIINDWRNVRLLRPDLITLDEATAIKSFDSQRSKKVKIWRAPYRYALTGTPIDNRADELFSIMEWVDPTELGRGDLFDKCYVVRDNYGRVKRYKALDTLHKKTKGFIARKTRFDPDVESYMPEDFHKVVLVDLSPKSKQLYKKISQDILDDLDEEQFSQPFSVDAFYQGQQGSGFQGAVGSKIMALNMICTHPRLLVDSAKDFGDWMERGEGTPRGSKYAWFLSEEGLLDDLPMTSPKIDEVVRDIYDLLDENPKSKILVFSFYKRVGDMLSREFGSKAVVFNGDMSISAKESAKMKFKTSDNVRIFLSSDAGGIGVDLPEANYLLNIDIPYSAGAADQRNNRHVRVSSEWDKVFVINYLVEDSVEHRIGYKRIEFKRAVGSAILDGTVPKSGVLNNDVPGLRDVLGNPL